MIASLVAATSSAADLFADRAKAAMRPARRPPGRPAPRRLIDDRQRAGLFEVPGGQPQQLRRYATRRAFQSCSPTASRPTSSAVRRTSLGERRLERVGARPAARGGGREAGHALRGSEHSQQPRASRSVRMSRTASGAPRAGCPGTAAPGRDRRPRRRAAGHADTLRAFAGAAEIGEADPGQFGEGRVSASCFRPEAAPRR